MTGAPSRRRTSGFAVSACSSRRRGSFESNESLGLLLRSQGAVAVGPRVVNTNRAQVAIGAGLAVNDERSVRRRSHAEPRRHRHVQAVVLPVRSPSHEHRHCLPVLPEPHQLGPPAYPARRQRQAGNLEGCLPVVEPLRHVRQPAAQRERPAQRRGCRPLVWLELLTTHLLHLDGLASANASDRIGRRPVRHRLVSLSVLIMLSALAPSASAQDATELAKQTQNPVSSLITMPFQGNWDFGLGDRDATGTLLNLQPVMPLVTGAGTRSRRKRFASR